MLLIRELRKRERRETLDNLRDPDLVREGEESTSRDIRSNLHDHSRRELDGKVLSDKDDLSNVRS